MSDEGTNMRSREKGDSLFTMIPLERWNVERRSTFRARVHGELGPADSVRPSIRHEERKLRRTFHRLWNADQRRGDLLARTHDGKDARVSSWPEGVHPTPGCPALSVAAWHTTRVYRGRFPVTETCFLVVRTSDLAVADPGTSLRLTMELEQKFVKECTPKDFGLLTTWAVTSHGFRAEPKSGMCSSRTRRAASLGCGSGIPCASA